MPRMRMLKPSFFANDVLAEVSPLGRLLFAGIWCMADREGRLEDRPKKIKAEILRYDSANVDRLLDELSTRGFILRYEIDGARFIQVVNFLKHQSPHKNEGPSTIPAPEQYQSTSVQIPEEHRNAPSSRAGVTGHLTLDIGELDTGTGEIQNPEEPSPGDDRVDEVYAHFKARVQPKARLCPRKKIAARLKRFSADELRQGIDHFAEDWWWMANNATQGAEWFFESDKRSEQFLLLQPRKTPNGTAAHGPPGKPIDAPPEVPANSPFLNYHGVS